MISARLIYKNSASSKEFNLTRSQIIDRGIYSGGALTNNPASFILSIAPFVASSYDGMVIVSDVTETLTITDGIISYVVLYAKYQNATIPTLQLVALDEATWLTSANKDYFITFAKIDLTVPSGGIPTSAITYNESDYAETLGKSPIKRSVANAAALPIVQNREGDLRVTTDTGHIWSWISGAWVDLVVQTAAATTYTGGPNWADGVTNPATTVELQLDKIITNLATAGGSAKIYSNGIAGAPDSIGAGTLYSALTQLLGLSNIRGRLYEQNVWTELNQFINSNAGFYAASFETTNPAPAVGSVRVVPQAVEPIIPQDGGHYANSVTKTYKIAENNEWRIVSEQRSSRVFLYPITSLVSNYNATGWYLEDYCVYWHKGVSASALILTASLNNFIPDGCTVTRVRAYVTPGAIRAPGNRMRLWGYRRANSSEVPAVFGGFLAFPEDDGTTNPQWIAANGLTQIIDTDAYHYQVGVRSGSGSGGDKLLSLEITYTEGNYLAVP